GGACRHRRPAAPRYDAHHRRSWRRILHNHRRTGRKCHPGVRAECGAAAGRAGAELRRGSLPDESRQPHPSGWLMGFHRPARQIEVFDISLMAVVTKAMGAFLVMMILLMPYYTSDPDVLKTSSQARDQLKEARREMEAMAQAMADNPNAPEAVRKALQAMEHSLQEADRKEDQLAKEAQALSSQLRRAHQEVDAAKAAAERARAAEVRAEVAQAATEQIANAQGRARVRVEVAEADMESRANTLQRAKRSA